MSQIFWLSLDTIQPSQLYISEAKLAAVMAWWPPATPDIHSALPIKRLNGRVIFTDGHTRAFATYQKGLTDVPVYWDADDLDWAAYQICVDWCLADGIESVMDLGKRLLNANDYQRLWLDRCGEMQANLEAQRQSKGIS